MVELVLELECTDTPMVTMNDHDVDEGRGEARSALKIANLVLGKVYGVKGMRMTEFGLELECTDAPMVTMNNHDVDEGRGEARSVLEIANLVLGDMECVKGTMMVP